MALVKFAFICDQCGIRGQEYQSYPHCIKCGDDVCLECCVAGSYDEESGTAICRPCLVKAIVDGERIGI